MKFSSWMVVKKLRFALGLCVSLSFASLTALAADDKDTYDVPVVVEHRSVDVAPPAVPVTDKSEKQKPAPDAKTDAKKLSTAKTKSATEKNTQEKAAANNKKTAAKKTTTKKTAPQKVKQQTPSAQKKSADTSNAESLKKKHRKTHKAT